MFQISVALIFVLTVGMTAYVGYTNGIGLAFLLGVIASVLTAACALLTIERPPDGP